VGLQLLKRIGYLVGSTKRESDAGRPDVDVTGTSPFRTPDGAVHVKVDQPDGTNVLLALRRSSWQRPGTMLVQLLTRDISWSCNFDSPTPRARAPTVPARRRERPVVKSVRRKLCACNVVVVAVASRGRGADAGSAPAADSARPNRRSGAAGCARSATRHRAFDRRGARGGGGQSAAPPARSQAGPASLQEAKPKAKAPEPAAPHPSDGRSLGSTGYTLPQGEIELGFFFMGAGVFDWLTVGTIPFPWVIAPILGGYSVNLAVKGGGPIGKYVNVGLEIIPLYVNIDTADQHPRRSAVQSGRLTHRIRGRATRWDSATPG
jgi:hypothetical protein